MMLLLKKYGFLYVLFPVLFISSCSYINFRLQKSRELTSKNQHYVIIGCSAAGYHAAKKLAFGQKNARVTCISDEKSTPYDKTKLHQYVSKAYDSKKIELNFWGNKLNFNLLTDTKVTNLDKLNKKLSLANGSSIAYDKLLIATGARSYVPDIFLPYISSSNLKFYNSKADIDAITDYVDNNPKAKIAILGAGIRSLELADGLKKRSSNVSISLFNRSMRFFGDLGDQKVDEMLLKSLAKANVNLFAPAVVNKVKNGTQFTIETNLGKYSFDIIVLALGTIPNSELAKQQVELNPDNSIKIDRYLRTSDPNIFAAGDVVSFKDHIGGGINRSAKWMAAKSQGEIAATNMLGDSNEYKYEQPVFFTSFFGVKVILSGKARLQTFDKSYVKSDENSYQRLVVENNRITSCALLWNKNGRKPNVFYIRKKIIDQSPINTADFL